jgi:hypothetical protein
MPSIIALKENITRQEFVNLIPKTARTLEIGPYSSPTIKQSQFPNVKYMDMFSAEEIKADKERYTNETEPPEYIDIIVSPEQRPTFETDLKFDYIYSAHNIEHHPDIIYHLNEMSKIAAGMHTKYFLTIPDKRYCFDYYQNPSDFTDMIEAYLEKRTKHSFGSYLRHTTYATHNNIYGHWMGDHGEDPRGIEININYATTLRSKIDSASDERQRKFADIHAWYFTNESFKYTINILNQLGLQPWRVDVVTPPQYMTPEFHAVMSLTRYVN